MTSPTGTIRPIHYPLNRSEDLESSTPNTPTIKYETLENWITDDTDERVPVVLELSLNEYVALATAIDVGRDIAYGDNSIYIWWLWVRSLIGMDLCDLILQCIQESSDIQEAISNYSGGTNISITQAENDANLASELVNDPVGCDNDIIYGMTTQLVEFADRLIKDLFERIDASQLSSTNIGYLLKLIPVVETLPIDEAFELTDKLVDDMETAYLSASTTQLKTDIACELFCIAQNNGCVLTLEDVRDYFEDKSGIVFTYTDVGSFLADFISGTFVGNAVYYGMNVLFFQIFAFGGKFLEYVFNDYLRTIQAMYNDPNADWSVECDACALDYYLEADFTTGQHGWFVNQADRGEYSAGVGWITSTLTNSVACYIEYNYTPDTYVLKSVQMRYGYEQAFPSGFKRLRLYDDTVLKDEIEISNGAIQTYPTLMGLSGTYTLVDTLELRLNGSGIPVVGSPLLVDRARIHIVSDTVPQEFYDDGWTDYIP